MPEDELAFEPAFDPPADDLAEDLLEPAEDLAEEPLEAAEEPLEAAEDLAADDEAMLEEHPDSDTAEGISRNFFFGFAFEALEPSSSSDTWLSPFSFMYLAIFLVQYGILLDCVHSHLLLGLTIITTTAK